MIGTSSDACRAGRAAGLSTWARYGNIAPPYLASCARPAILYARTRFDHQCCTTLLAAVSSISLTEPSSEAADLFYCVQ